MVQETTTQMYFRPHWKCSEQFGERHPFPASVSDGVATLNSGLLLLTIPLREGKALAVTVHVTGPPRHDFSVRDKPILTSLTD